LAYLLARIFAAIGLLAPLTFFLALIASDLVPEPDKIWGLPLQSIAVVVAFVSVLFILVAAIGSALAILVGWSADRRKLERLEVKSANEISN
jgi:hypothetical protein